MITKTEEDNRIIGVGSLSIERILYGQDHSMKKKEANVSKLMFCQDFEDLPSLQILLIKALEAAAWDKNCDLIKIPTMVEEEVAFELDYLLVLRAGHNFFAKSRS